MKRLLILLLSCKFLLASPTTTPHYAMQWVDKHKTEYSEEDKRLFMLGVVFPDITFIASYLNLTYDEKYAAGEISIQDVYEETSPFESGRKFYFFFEDFRTALIQKHDLFRKYKNVPEEKRELLTMFIEDHIYFEEIDKKRMKAYLRQVSEDEVAQGIKESALKTWHSILMRYYTMAPYSILRTLSFTGHGVFSASKEVVAEWSKEFPNLIELVPVQVYIADLEQQFTERYL